MATRTRTRPPKAPPVVPAAALPPMQAGYVLRRFVVVPGGRAASGAHKQLTGLQEIVNGKLEGETYYITRDTVKAKDMALGHIYDIPTSPEGTTFSIGQKRYVGEYEDRTAVLTWQALELGRVSREKAEAFEKRHADELSVLKDAIAPIRVMYQSLGTPSRVAFEVWMLNYIRKGIYF